MTKKRILIVGDGNHQFITNYGLFLVKGRESDYLVDILSTTIVQKENFKYYNEVIQIEDNQLYQFVRKIKGLRRFYRFLHYQLLINKLSYYDIAHFHFIRTDSFFISRRLRGNSVGKIVFSIWGSDLYRLKKREEHLFVASCKRADFITFSNQQSLNHFKITFGWEHNNLRIARFGSKPLEILRGLSKSKDNCKVNLGWNANKFAIVIGYNMAPAQQHLEILKQFQSEQLLNYSDKVQLILPITYVGTEKYKKQILDKLESLPFESFVYDQFLDDSEVANIRQGSDIMLQLQLTDQFSGSMQEHLFARNVVVTGSWLPYDVFKDSGVWFLIIDHISDLITVLPSVFDDYGSHWDKTIGNAEIISTFLSWESNIPNWISIYKE
jgi:hypothetical protein